MAKARQRYVSLLTVVTWVMRARFLTRPHDSPSGVSAGHHMPHCDGCSARGPLTCSVYACEFVYMHLVYAYVYICVYMYLRVCAWVLACICTGMHVCMYHVCSETKEVKGREGEKENTFGTMERKSI